VFEDDQIYRAGGDEFSMIILGAEEEELKERIEKVKKLCEKTYDISFALGGAVERDSSNVRMALRRADERMYEDKRKYYAGAPERANENRRNRAVTPVTEETVREQNIFREMNYDTLTGLPSMSYFFRLAEEGRKKMHEQDIPSALLFFNLKGIKYYNKKFGFTEGDNLIKELGKIIAKLFGEERSSRFGQDHFAVFTEEEGITKKIIRVFREMKSANHGRSLPVRVGIYPDSMGMVETSVACDRAKYA
jgi:diguanylate cyclase (GGDEF)-like protein